MSAGRRDGSDSPYGDLIPFEGGLGSMWKLVCAYSWGSNAGVRFEMLGVSPQRTRLPQS